MAIIDTGLNGVCLEENTLTDGSKVRNVLIGDLEKEPHRITCDTPEAANKLYELLTAGPDTYTVEGF
jgi:hypothetical protein